MSVGFVILPAASMSVAAWPVVSSIAAAAATALGYRIASVTSAKERVAAEAAAEASAEVLAAESKATVKATIEVRNWESIARTMPRDTSFSIVKEDLRLVFARSPRDGFEIQAYSESLSKDELHEAAKEVVNRIVQQYVYQQLMEELKERGFTVAEEEVDTDRRIRLKIRKWDDQG